MQGCTSYLMILRVLYHKAVGTLAFVVFVEFVKLNDLNQFVGILRISGITGSLQTTSPAFIIGGLQIEQTAVALTIYQEARMILKRLIGRIIGPETFVAGIIIVVDLPPIPPIALDAKMVVALSDQFALSCPTLKEALCERDAGRDFPTVHLLNGDVLVLVNILLITLVPLNLSVGSE